MEQKKYRELIEFDVIQAAIQGDDDSINQIIAFFSLILMPDAKENLRMNLGMSSM